MDAASNNPAPAGKRRPNPEDLDAILEALWEGQSLRKICERMGLHTPSTSTWLNSDPGRREQYARAQEGRAEHYQEQALEFSQAAATGKPVIVNGEEVVIDAAGLRVHLDAIKWANARMAPKTAPVQRIDLTSRTRQMTDDEIAAEIAALEGGEPDQD